MSKLILLFVLIFSNATLASNSQSNIVGDWKGDFKINGKKCKPTTLEISKSAEIISIYAAMDNKGNHAFECGTPSYTYYMWLEENYDIKGKELWRYDSLMGEITPEGVTAKNRFCDERGCEDYDFIKIKQLSENKISIWIDFSGAVLTGELTK